MGCFMFDRSVPLSRTGSVLLTVSRCNGWLQRFFEVEFSALTQKISALVQLLGGRPRPQHWASTDVGLTQDLRAVTQTRGLHVRR